MCKANMDQEGAVVNAENSLAIAIQEVREISRHPIPTQKQSKYSTKLQEVKADLLKLEGDYKDIQKQLINLAEKPKHSQKDIDQVVFYYENCVNREQEIHAEIAYVSFFVENGEQGIPYDDVLAMEVITARIAEVSNNISRINLPPEIYKLDDIQKYRHDFGYHLSGILSALDEIKKSAMSFDIQRPFPIPVPTPIPPQPYHPANPGPAPSQPDQGAAESCKDDCNSQYDADCDACGQYVTDPRARALCYSSAASRQGVCIRNCYH